MVPLPIVPTWSRPTSFLTSSYKQARRISYEQQTKHELRSLVTGEARFAGEAERLDTFLYAYPVVSPVAYGRLVSLDFSLAQQTEGYVCHFDSSQIPGKNAIGAVTRPEEPLLATEEVHYIGQPIAVVVAQDQAAARKAARLVKVVVDPLDPILTLDEAIKHKQYYEKPMTVACGDLKAGFAQSHAVEEGNFASHEQEHSYIETQRAFAMHGEHRQGVKIHCGTQAVTDVQEVVALLLNLPLNAVEVDVARVGGAFGGERARRVPCGLVLLHSPLAKQARTVRSFSIALMILPGRENDIRT